MLENDWLEAIVALPEQLFYNTGIATYVWMRHQPQGSPSAGARCSSIDARELWVEDAQEPRREAPLPDEAQIEEHHPPARRIRRRASASRSSRTRRFGYRTITVEQPLRARFVVTGETWDAIEEEKAIAKIDEETRATLVRDLNDMARDEESDPCPSHRPHCSTLSSGG